MVGATLAELRDEGLLPDPVTAGDHVAVKEAVLPFNRFPDADTRARPRDALHRRGHGHRPHLRPRVRQEPDRGRRPAARATACVFLSLADRDKAVGAAGRPRASSSSASRSPPPSGTADAPRGARHPGRARVVAKVGEHDRHRRRRAHLHRARSTSSSTARGAAAPGPTAPTSAPPRSVHGVPCLTTAAAGLAAAEGMADWAAPRAAGADAAGVPPRRRPRSTSCDPAVCEQPDRGRP